MTGLSCRGNLCFTTLGAGLTPAPDLLICLPGILSGPVDSPASSQQIKAYHYKETSAFEWQLKGGLPRELHGNLDFPYPNPM